MKKSTFLIASAFALLMASPALADNNQNSSSIEQIGTGVSATVTQDGSGNVSDVNIKQGTITPGTNLNATVHQGGDTTQNTANIMQDDTDQLLNADQHGAGGTVNLLDVTQSGVNNDTEVLQNGTTNNNTATVFQTGTGALNTATISQGGTGNTNGASVSQSGAGLTATVTQN